jgi:hypothetical protein
MISHTKSSRFDVNGIEVNPDKIRDSSSTESKDTFISAEDVFGPIPIPPGESRSQCTSSSSDTTVLTAHKSAQPMTKSIMKPTIKATIKPNVKSHSTIRTTSRTVTPEPVYYTEDEEQDSDDSGSTSDSAGAYDDKWAYWGDMNRSGDDGSQEEDDESEDEDDDGSGSTGKSEKAVAFLRYGRS